MDKNKIELIILMIIIAFGINYGIHSFYFSPQLEGIKNAKVQYDKARMRLDELKVKSKQAKQHSEENEKIKEEITKLDKLAPKAIDTPQLIYEIYTACINYGITGENLNLQLVNGKGTDNKEGVPNSTGAAKNTGAVQEPKLLTLTVILTASGEKTRIEEFVKNVENIASRKLNVKSISLTLKDSAGASKNTAVGKAEYLSTEIILNQYIQEDISSASGPKNYDFYNEKIGFDKISDIFGSYAQ
jgi:hypothetical protein